MDALKGKRAIKHTFTLYITIGTEKALALVDTGSTTTFITPELAQEAQCQILLTIREKNQVANGDTLWTEFICPEIQYVIQGVSFQSTFRFLKLQSYDIILGVDWIYAHSPVELKLKAFTLKVRNNEDIVTFYDASLPASSDIPHSNRVTKLLKTSICGALL
jgi:hypothetical protein